MHLTMHTLRAALIASALLAALPLTASAQASNRFERGSWEIDEQIEHPCNGELIQITGTYTVTSRRTVDANGRVHFSATTNTQIRGVGPSGEYNVTDRQSLSDHFIDDEFYPENLTSVSKFHLVGRGKAPNFVITIVHRILIEEDGTVKHDFERVSGQCSG